MKNSLTTANKLTLLIAGSITLYFLSISAFPKLIITESSYGEYYWFRAPWLFIHVVAGLIATLIGWSQFIPAFRAKYLKAHRLVGKIYISCIGIAAPTAFYLALVSPGLDVLGKISFFIVPLVWLVTVSMAYVAVLKRKIVQHQEWMLRNYVVTFFFTAFVILTKYLPYELMGATYSQSIPFVTWISWALPLFMTEVILQAKKIF